MILQRKKKSKKKNQPSSSSWALQFNLQAKPKSFTFYFKATNFVPLPFSLALRLTKSDPHLSPTVHINRSKSGKAKLLGILRKLRFGSAKMESLLVDVEFPLSCFCMDRGKFDAYQEQKCIGSTITRFIGLLLLSISQKNHKGIILYLSITTVFLAVIFIVAIDIYLSSTLRH